MKSTRGRRRLLTDAQVEKIMAWHRTRKSLKAFAQEMGLEASFVTYVIGRKGQYKQPSPELRQAALDERHAKMQALREGGWL